MMAYIQGSTVHITLHRVVSLERTQDLHEEANRFAAAWQSGTGLYLLVQQMQIQLL